MSSDIPDPTDHDLVATFVAAYPDYVVERLATLGIAAPVGMAEAVVDGQERLRHELTELLAEPPDRQDRSPLEVFQSALEAPTDVLVAAGTEPVSRDPVAVNALPGDVYDLAPASSQALGAAALEAHLAWGVAKARAVAGMVPAAPSEPANRRDRSTIALVGSDPVDRAALEEAAVGRGLGLVWWANPGSIERGLDAETPLVGLVDVEHRAADDAIRLLVAAGVRTVAFGSGVDDFAMARFGALGADAVLQRTELFSRLGEILPQQI